MPDFDLSITICSWNTVQDLRECLMSLRACADEGNFEVIVVDNASSDDSADMVETEFPEFRLLRQSTNLGFAGGHNLAIRERRGRDVALLNSDTIVHRGAIGQLIQVMQTNFDLGIVGPKLLNSDGTLQPSCRTFPNPIAAAFRNTILGRMFPNNPFTRTYLMEDWNHDSRRDVDWISGAAIFMRKEAVDAVGVLDENLFMFFEDVDLCKRTWDAGFRVMYLPTAVITHKGGKSTSKAPNRMIIRFHRSMYQYFAKHNAKAFPEMVRPLVMALVAIPITLRAFVFLASNKVHNIQRTRAK